MKIATAIEHMDVHGKKQFYIKIANGNHETFINVGESTYKRVMELDKVQELPLEEENNNNNENKGGDNETITPVDNGKRKR